MEQKNKPKKQSRKPAEKSIPSKRNCHFHGIKYSTEQVICKPNIEQSFYKFTEIYGMKHGMYQAIVKINLCCSHINETTCADYKKPGFWK